MFLFLQIRKMTSANIPGPVRGPVAGGPDLAQDTGKGLLQDKSCLWVSNISCEQKKHFLIVCFKMCHLLTLADVRRAGLGGGPIRGVGGGPRVHEGGGPTPGIEAAAVDLGQYLHYWTEIAAFFHFIADRCCRI